jgi:hypothetical protein
MGLNVNSRNIDFFAGGMVLRSGDMIASTKLVPL